MKTTKVIIKTVKTLFIINISASSHFVVSKLSVSTLFKSGNKKNQTNVINSVFN